MVCVHNFRSNCWTAKIEIRNDTSYVLLNCVLLLISQEMRGDPEVDVEATKSPTLQTREQAVQLWLHDISVRQNAIKILARATLEHFYQMLFSESCWGTLGFCVLCVCC